MFGVLPDQWEPEVLLEAQRMIVVSSERLSPTGLLLTYSSVGARYDDRGAQPRLRRNCCSFHSCMSNAFPAVRS